MERTTNFTQFEAEEDAFEDIYSNPILNYSMVVLNFLGILSCIGLGFIVWFERSGQAGLHRTLGMFINHVDTVSGILFQFMDNIHVRVLYFFDRL